MSFSVDYDFTSNSVISSSQMNLNFSSIETAVNSIQSYIGTGVITNAMLATITTAGKVSGAALTGLASTPSGAGILPIANGGTEFDTGDICFSSAAKNETGWTEVTSTYSARYIRVGSTGLATGGNATHTHTGPSHTHGVSGTTGTTTGSTSSGADGNTLTQSHSHSVSLTSDAGGTGNTGAANSDPLYVDLRMFQRS